jgi:hypothetical protein
MGQDRVQMGTNDRTEIVPNVEQKYDIDIQKQLELQELFSYFEKVNPELINTFSVEELNIIRDYIDGVDIDQTPENRQLLSAFEETRANLISKPVLPGMKSTIFLSEGFDDGLPAGWSNVSEQDNAFLWEFGTFRGGVNAPMSGNVAFADSDAAGSGNYVHTTITTSPINISGATTVNLTFDHVYRAIGSQRGYVRISVDDGDNWETIITYSTNQGSSTGFGANIILNPVTASFDLSAFVSGEDEFLLQFEFDDANGFNWYWAIDNVLVFEPAAEPLPAVLISPANAATNVTLNPTLSWTAGAGAAPDEYDVYFGTSPTPPLAASNVTETTWATPELDYETTYYWNIVAKNAAGSADASPTRSFTTLADPTITELPYSENFSDVPVGTIPVGWTRESNSSRPWGATTTAALIHSGNRGLVTGFIGTSAKNEWVFTPPIALEEGTSYTLSFFYRAPGWAGTADRIKVYVGDEATPASMLAGTLLVERHDLVPNFVEIVAEFTPDATGTYHLAWFNDSPDFDLDGVTIDTITLIETPTDPIASLNPSETLAFGTAYSGFDKTATVNVTNSGGGTLEVTGVSSSTGDITSNFTSTISIGAVASETITFTLNTDQAGAYEGETVTITTNVGAFDLDVTAQVQELPTSIVEAFGGADNAAVLARLTGWSASGFSLFTSAGVNDSRRMSFNFWSGSAQTGFIQLEPVNAGSNPVLMFDYNVRNWASGLPNQGPATIGDDFDIRVLVSTDFGASFDEIDQITQATHDATINYTTKSYDLSAYANEVIVVRISNARLGGDYWINLDNFVVGTVTAGFMYGSQGWRVISAPVAGASLADLFEGLWLQGLEGGDTEAGTANVRFFDPALNDYTVPANASVVPGRGVGIAAKIYSDDNFDGTPDGFPKVFRLSGVAPNNDVVPVAIETGWNMVGNPYGIQINATTQTVGSGFSSDLYFYDPIAQEWVSTDNAVPEMVWNGNVKPYEGFWVQGTAPAPVFEFNTDDPIILSSSDPVESLLLSISNGNYTGRVGVAFMDSEKVGSSYLAPMRSNLVELFFLNDTDYLMTRNIGSEIAEEITLPLGLFSTESGTAQISWRLPNDLGAISYYLIDHATGVSHLMTENGTLTVDLGAMNMKLSEGYELDAESIPNPSLKYEGDARFSVVISPTTTSTEPIADLPTVFTLNQNYPNPFNPTTQLSYDLPESADVRLDVFNIQGQRVATLVNATQNAGRYNVTFDARNLASGVYIYRLQAGAHVMTKKMTLVK